MRVFADSVVQAAGVCVTLCSPLLAHATPASTYQQVHDQVFAPAQVDAAAAPEVRQEQAVYAAGQLPQYPVTASSIAAAGVGQLRRNAQRTLQDHVDLMPRLVKLVHANGICLAGQWQITEPTPYTGYLRQGARGLFLGRASVSLSETRRDQPRGLAFAGKIFPTLDPQQPVSTANFFVADVLAGTRRDHYLRTGMTNDPALGFRWAAIPVAMKVATAFMGTDRQPQYRPVDNLAALGEAGPVRAPRYLMIRPAASNPLNDAADFRDELNLNQQQVPAWDFDILASDRASKPEQPGWQRIGRIHLNESVVSYACDRQLHFGHAAINPKKGDPH